MPDDPQALTLPIDADLVRRLIAQQFPQWRDLDVVPVLPGGWDNRTFRLGDDKLARLPSDRDYVAQVEKEQHWLPQLAAHLSLPIPAPIAKGAPTEFYPWPWSVYGWLDGEPARDELIDDKPAFARAVAGFLTELHRIDASDGPPPGPHNFFRGGPLSLYDGETRAALETLSGFVDTGRALAVWETAVHSSWNAAPVWVHGDISAGNLLMKDGALHAVIDFGCAAVGDPACDLAINWTLFDDAARRAFRSTLAVDAGTWARGQGWALWKALITIAKLDDDLRENDPSNRTLRCILDDYRCEHGG
ncbi:TPA: aminoglycoside phosphotransferase family protein [Burkholderia aenigmatica]|uniref:aminoglycoside phosphotransferase family protein n=1 Tax=Burkholderia sp. AU45251 TaxID=3059204 RepID=UPI002654B377|nr:aminoglycoside phosphotransferase family protein [Burkholderia sp. AU45251]HDR9486770.1 aminoglycoside phosphotransferase family protein [Burkholderia aenigmatica]MDN7519621.1 aminoglycoside phosphotransferase family protein [Burkholderia sp. AU45251]HDR9518560.1 aminoglycoside phosphotransferase family protein [Burkholderia aenigmatica]HDR9595427.1 aminoglycoside phosphotransferase family protein [Burkholderia aenigmatica]HDR9602404.1 aminoglycoside phosphotransferase family protein [Burkh